MKKVLSVLLATATAVSVCGGLAACGDDSMTLTVWAPSASISTYKKIANSFKNAYPEYKDYTIKFEAKEEDTVQNDISPGTKNKANVFFFPSDHIDGMRKLNALQPLTQTYAELVQERDVDKVWQDAIRKDANGVDQIYAFPATYDNGYFLYYDKSFFSASDVESLDTMQSKAKNAGKQIGFAYGSGFYASSMFWTAGVTFGYTDDSLKTYQTTVKSDAGYAVGAALCNYFSPSVNGSGTSQTIIDIDVNTGIGKGFGDESMVAAIGGTWAYLNIEQQMTLAGRDINDIGMTILPKFKYTLNGVQKEERMTSFIGYKYCGVNGQKSTAQIKASLALAAHLTSEEAQLARFKKLKAGPSNKNLLANNDDVKTSELLKAFHDQEDTAGVIQHSQCTAFWSPDLIKNIVAGTVDSSNIKTAINTWSNNMLGIAEEK